MLQNNFGGWWTEPKTKAIKSIDNDHAYIHAGKRFTTFHKATILSAGTLEFSLVTPATGVIHYRPMKVSPSADKVDIAFFEGATVNVAGTQLAYFNRNRSATAVAGTVLRHGTTFSSNGAALTGFSDWLPGSEGIGTIRLGSSSNDADEIVLKPNTTYRILITNGSSASNTIGFIFNHYEEEA